MEKFEFKHKEKVNAITKATKLIEICKLENYKPEELTRITEGKLDEYAKLIGLNTKINGWNGSDAIRLWNENKLNDLKEYVLSDVQITFGIFKRVKEVGLL